jgi:hypothetical protein
MKSRSGSNAAFVIISDSSNFALVVVLFQKTKRVIYVLVVTSVKASNPLTPIKPLTIKNSLVLFVS